MELTDGTNVLQWLEESARRDPDKIAFADESEEITYSELLFQAQSVGTALASSGVLREAVAVLLPRGIGQVVSIFGVAESGGCYAILDSGSPQDRLAAIVSSFRPLSLLVCDETAELGERLLPGRCLRIEDARRVPADLALLADIRRASRPDDLLYVLYTSGSTGTPKGVMVSHANVISYVVWFARCFGIDSETIFGSQTPLYFSMSVSDLFATVRQGATMHLIPRRLFSFPVRLVQWLNERGVNALYWVPTALGLLARWDVLSVAPLHHVKKVMFAGEVMPTPTLNYWMDHLPGARFADLFGPTETTDICTYYKVTRRLRDDEPLPIGRPCEGMKAVVLGSDGRAARTGEVGELYVGGPFVARGYLGDADKTARAFVRNPLDPTDPTPFYRTGDLVRPGADGDLRYVSRADAQIKRSGYRIELGEVEAAATACEGVSSCAAVWEAARERMVLFVAGTRLDARVLHGLLKRRLPGYMMPDAVEVMASLPLNRNGKIDRRALLAACPA